MGAVILPNLPDRCVGGLAAPTLDLLRYIRTLLTSVSVYSNVSEIGGPSD